MKTKKARKTKSLHRGKKLEKKKPLFVIAEHLPSNSGSGKVATNDFTFTTPVSKPSPTF